MKEEIRIKTIQEIKEDYRIYYAEDISLDFAPLGDLEDKRQFEAHLP